MAYLVEFGNRGGVFTQSLEVPNAALAIQTARTVVAVMLNTSKRTECTEAYWTGIRERSCSRVTWQGREHFAAITKLSQTSREPASATLWAKPAPTKKR